MNEPSETERIVAAAHALGLDAPIIHYRMVGDRIELWTCHGGPYTYQPGRGEAYASSASPSPAAKKVVKKKKP
jgi:hypothetical protein